RVRVRAEVVVERDVLLEDDDKVPDRRRRRRFAIAFPGTTRRCTHRADARERRPGEHSGTEHSCAASHWAPLKSRPAPPPPIDIVSRRRGPYATPTRPRVSKLSPPRADL